MKAWLIRLLVHNLVAFLICLLDFSPLFFAGFGSVWLQVACPASGGTVPLPFLFCCCQTQPILEFPRFLHPLPSPPHQPTNPSISHRRNFTHTTTSRQSVILFPYPRTPLSSPPFSHSLTCSLTPTQKSESSEREKRVQKKAPASKRYRNNFAPATFSPTFAGNFFSFLSFSSVSSFFFSSPIFHFFFNRVCRKNYFRDFSHSPIEG